MDAGLARGNGDFSLSRALVTLSARRQASQSEPSLALSDDGLATICGVSSEPAVAWADAPSQLLAPDPQDFERLKAWRRQLYALDGLPPLLAGAIAFEQWMQSPPLLHNSAMGGVLIACYLRIRGLVNCIFQHLRSAFASQASDRSRNDRERNG